MALRTPLYDWHLSHKARMVEFGGWDMPVQYTGVVAEHHAVRKASGLFDISHMGRLTFDGPDTVEFLNHVVTNEVATMKPGQIRYALVCDEAGGILDDVLVYRLDGLWMMVVNASNRIKIVDWFNQRKTKFNVAMTDRTIDWAMVAVQGPGAVPLIESIFPGSAALKYYVGRRADDKTIVSRTGYTGEDGVEVILPADQMADWCIQLMSRPGAPLPCGLGARDTLRMEAAMPLYGHELSEQIDPLHAGLGWAVKLEKADFVGKAALANAKGDIARPVRVGLKLNGSRSAREHCPILAGEQPIGEVTSGCPSPTLGHPIAMGYVPPTHSAVGTMLAVDIRGKTAQAEVVPLPFYQRPK